MPFLLTGQSFYERFDFTQTGQIGDTIGGITAPFVNLIGAFLVFYALQAQVKANELIQDQIDDERDAKESETESQNLNQLYSYLTESINGFQFKSLPIENLKQTGFIETEVEYKGGAAIYHLLSQIRCHYHGTQEDLQGNQSVSELISILKVMSMLLDKLENTTSKNKEILIVLVRHLFEYKIITRIRDEDEDMLNLTFCDICECNHGLPDEMRMLVLEIKRKLK